MPPAVWLINGIPGAGKTTTARALAQRLPRSAHIEGDRLQAMVVSGRVLPGEQPPEEAARQIRLCFENQCLLARSFVLAGFSPVSDYVIVSRARLEEYRAHLSGLTVYLVTVAPGVDAAVQRDRDRSEKTVAPAWIHLDAIIRQELSDVGLYLDNSRMSVEETVETILARTAEAKI